MSEAEKIADGLTEAQKAMLFGLPADESWLNSRELICRVESSFGANSLRAFGKSGLVDGRYERLGRWHRLTPLGLEVRRLLEAQP